MLTATALNYKIGKHYLIRDVSFQIRPGELLAILGANGAGKSTLINMLSGERKPTSGEILLFNKKLGDYSPQDLSKKRTILQQQHRVHLSFSVKEILLMGRYPHFKYRPDKKDLTVVEEAMEVCGIGHLLDRSYLSLSGGEQQRVQFARVLCQIWDQPESLLLMDEPVAALDPQYQQQTMAIARAFSQKGFMVIAILHEINLAAQYADRILMLKGGRKWLDGTPTEVLTPTHIYSIFNTAVDVMVNARTLKPLIVPKQISLDFCQFNSSFSASTINKMELIT